MAQVKTCAVFTVFIRRSALAFWESIFLNLPFHCPRDKKFISKGRNCQRRLALAESQHFIYTALCLFHNLIGKENLFAFAVEAGKYIRKGCRLHIGADKLL